MQRAVVLSVAFAGLLAACGPADPSMPPSAAAAEARPRPLPSPLAELQPVKQPDQTFVIAPVSARIEGGVPYLLEVLTHCGFTETSFDVDGSFWDVVGRPDDGGGNPPPGIGNPYDAGVFVLTGPGTAIWTSAAAIRVPLERGEPGPRRVVFCD